MNLPIPSARRLRIWPTLLLLGGAILVVLVSSLYSHSAVEEIITTTKMRALARTARMSLEQTLSLFKDMETGVRGFELTGKDNYLDPYNQARVKLPSVYVNLKKELGENLPEGITWPEIDTLMQQRISLLEQGIASRRQLGAAVLNAIDLLNAGKTSMDSIRDRFQRIDVFQEQRIARMDEAVRFAQINVERAAWFADGLAFTFIALAIFLLLRERRIRKQLERRLWQANTDLESKVSERTVALDAALERIASFAAEQDRNIEAERRRIAREVHDQIGQVFTAIKLIIQSIPASSYPEGQREALDQALEMGITCTRRIAAELRPPLLDDLGLAAALEHFAGQVSRSTPLACEVHIEDAESLDASQSLGLFRIIQEAVTNVLRHAGASRIVIAGAREQAQYRLRIEDNGRGFEPASVRPDAMGLNNIHERARLLNGRSSLSPLPNIGTTVEIFLPLPESLNHEHPAP